MRLKLLQWQNKYSLTASNEPESSVFPVLLWADGIWREWLKGFIKRVPTLCQYCGLLRTANIDVPVVSYNSGYKYDRSLTFTYVHWMNGVIGIGLEDPNTGGCGSRKAILGPDASWVHSECGVWHALKNGAGDRDEERNLVRFATMASEWEKQLLALIDKL